MLLHVILLGGHPGRRDWLLILAEGGSFSLTSGFCLSCSLQAALPQGGPVPVLPLCSPRNPPLCWPHFAMLIVSLQRSFLSPKESFNPSTAPCKRHYSPRNSVGISAREQESAAPGGTHPHVHALQHNRTEVLQSSWQERTWAAESFSTQLSSSKGYFIDIKKLPCFLPHLSSNPWTDPFPSSFQLTSDPPHSKPSQHPRHPALLEWGWGLPLDPQISCSSRQLSPAWGDRNSPTCLQTQH